MVYQLNLNGGTNRRSKFEMFALFTSLTRVFRKSLMYKYASFTSLREWFVVISQSNHGIKTATYPSSGLLS